MFVSPLTAADEDPEPGIWLEMGLLACERGEIAEAERLFSHIEREFAPPPGIRLLIERARQQICPQRRPILGRVAAGLAWSSNVNLGPQQTQYALSSALPFELRLVDRLHPRSDGQAIFELERAWPVGTARLTPFAQWRRNFSAHDFDDGLLGLSWQWEGQAHAERRWLGGATLSQSWLGGQRHAETLLLNATHAWSAFALSALWQASRYPQAPAFDATLWAVRGGIGARHGDWRFSARLGALADLARDARRPGGDRHGVLADMRIHHPGPLASSIDFSWRGEWSRSQTAYLPGLFEMRRVRRFAQFEGIWSIPVSAETSVRLSWSHTQTAENVPFLGYRQTTWSVAWVHVWR